MRPCGGKQFKTARPESWLPHFWTFGKALYEIVPRSWAISLKREFCFLSGTESSQKFPSGSQEEWSQLYTDPIDGSQLCLSGKNKPISITMWGLGHQITESPVRSTVLTHLVGLHYFRHCETLAVNEFGYST